MKDPDSVVPIVQVSINFEDEGWKLVTFGTKWKTPVPPKGLEVQNRFTTTNTEKPNVPTNNETGPPNSKPHGAIRYKQ